MERTEAFLVSLRSRLSYIAEVADAVTQWADDRGSPVFLLLDEIEVDVLAILGNQGSSNQEDSTYIMHTSWIADASTAGMYESLPKRVVALMSHGFGKILLAESDAEKWLLSWGSAMQELLVAFTGATNLDHAMGRMIGLDIMLTNLLSFIAAMRLNPMLDR
ncbi:hypothetical protein [Cupriavidus malaysiensis]|uniref:Uncharacterized protein n=1 Tax=Cupriavidus malaysiensis TaxID=367825 RepID=A0ABM6FGL9_9BURK|nr:hypothetical protein [Cupriavidus malaysiensis]AOZ11087.1 hypothetical protein BKK80_34570 [Cupriavidus malaysiensis]